MGLDGFTLLCYYCIINEREETHMVKLNDEQKAEVQSYIDLVKTLKGNPRYEKSLQNGIQNLMVEDKEYTTSKKGNNMLVVTYRNVETGGLSKSYYMPFRAKDYEKGDKVEKGKMYQCLVKGAGGFINVQPLINIGEGSPFVVPPLSTANVIGYDIEVYAYNWSIVFTDVMTDIEFEIEDDVELLKKFMNKHNESLFVGFNNKGYDTHILKAIISGKNPYPISQQIIHGEDKQKVYKMYDGNCIKLLEVDLMQDNRGFSLKEHGAFMGMEIKESDIDFDIDRELTTEEKLLNMYYNKNDVQITIARMMNIIGALKTKALVCQMYDMPYSALYMTNGNLIAEILKATFHEDRGDYYEPYEAPDWLYFNNKDILHQVALWVWNGQPLRKKYDVEKKEWKDDLGYKIEMRDLTIQVGSGGVHGAVPNYIKSGTIIYQDDVGSLYPTTAVNHGYISRNIPEEFKHLYADILKKRMVYKKAGDHDKEQAMKLLLNTFYGVLRAKFNKLYDPRQAIMINLTGQLAMLDLADKIEPHAYISALNTDSINYEPFSEEDKLAIDEIKKDWEKRSGYTLDQDVITDIAQRDINNYVCKFDSGKVKKKGAVSLGGGVKINKAIVYDALANFFMEGKEPEQTIRECQDMLQFQIISKTGWTYQDTRNYVGDEWESIQKVNRSFAVKEGSNYPMASIRKYKEPSEKEVMNEETAQLETVEVPETIAKAIPNEPKFYTIDNNAIDKLVVKREDIDEDYYINLAKMEIMAYELDKETLKEKLKDFDLDLDEYGEKVA